VSGATAPPRRDWGALALVALGVVFGFPYLTALAMGSVPAGHGAVVTGLIPAATALMAVWRAGERPRWTFWLACAAGAAAVCAFAAAEGAGRLRAADLLLFGAVLAAALGYAEGARLSRAWGAGGGVRVISWALVFAAPLALAIVLVTLGMQAPRHYGDVSARAWLGFAYVSVISAYAGFFAWYAGLARGGVARVSQVQLVQPVLGVLWAALLLGEPLRARTVLAALLVVACAASAVLFRGRANPGAPTRVAHHQ
jgi:drug/metabolite transporter (DMT)-like permease